MALFRRSDLQRRALEKSLQKHEVESSFRRLANEANRNFDIFLSHSFLDATEVKVLSQEIESLGFSVYVDWIVDPQLDRNRVTKETAETLRTRMGSCKALFFATSQHSQNSKWMPWELGYFDGKKNRVAVLPVVDDTSASSDRYVGQEYLTLYPYVGIDEVAGKDRKTLWIHDSEYSYISFSSWLTGKNPYDRKS